MKKILVIGGGASGMMAALSAANINTDITIYEKNNRLGKKILATGNGKCNMTNRKFSINHYYVDEPNKLEQYFDEFSVEDTIRFFNEMGLMTRERDGYIYPYCEQASAVQEILLQQLAKNHIKTVTEVTDIKLEFLKKENKFKVCSNKTCEKFDSVILACGSLAGLKETETAGYDLAEIFSHSLNPLYPALVQIHCKEKFFKMVSGVRAKVRLSLYINHERVDEEQGELQLTDYGISGIAVFQLSRQIALALDQKLPVEVEIDFLPDINLNEWKEIVNKRILKYMGQSLSDFMLGTIHKKLVALFMKQAKLENTTVINSKNKNDIYKMMLRYKHLRVTATKTNPFLNAQVCAGGIALSELTEHLESKFQKNLFICGEMLDVDGKCGGYNLQWAWTSGYIAGKYAGKES